MTRRPALATIAAIACVEIGVVAWYGLIRTWLATENLMQDWIVYYSAGTAARSGALTLLYDSERFTSFQVASFAHRLTAPFDLHPFLYLPHYLLLLAPLSRLPFVLSCAVFLAATGAAAVAALAWQEGGHTNWRRAIMLLFFPATCIDAMTGQNGLLSAALMTGGFRTLERRPALAGALFAALTYKPQLFMLVPVALVAARAWRALAACGVCAAALVLASAALFGVQSWNLWVGQAFGAHDPALEHWFSETFLRGYSLYVCAALAGMSDLAAQAIQATGSLAAASAVWWAYHRPGAAEAKLAILLAASILATPHLQAYDMVLLAAAVILLFSRAEGGIGPGELALFALVWILPFFRPWTAPSGRAVLPLVLIALLAYAVARAMPSRRDAPTSVPLTND
jgi:alpha-1,2-mannosyltransferase